MRWWITLDNEFPHALGQVTITEGRLGAELAAEARSLPTWQIEYDYIQV